MASPLQPNTPAPNFSLPDQNNELHTLSQYQGQWLLIYFYPKDDTPGCTTQACGIRDNWAQFQQAGIQVLGISKDTVKSHAKFVQKHSLPFPVLADTQHTVAEQFGVWAPKKFMGREFLGVHRISFLIDPQGIIRKVYDQVNVLNHAQTILQDYQSLTNQ